MREVLGIDHERRSREIITGLESRSGAAPGGSPSQIPYLLERHGLRPEAVAALIDPPKGALGARLEAMILHGAIDADRIDYLQRDAHYTGVAHGVIDAARLLETVQSHAGRLVWAEKGLNAVEGFLVGRSLMYSSVYYHKTVRAAEVMAQAAVERLPGYPDSARELFVGTDGDLFAVLDRAGGRPSVIARALRERRLFKRVHVAGGSPTRGDAASRASSTTPPCGGRRRTTWPPGGGGRDGDPRPVGDRSAWLGERRLGPGRPARGRPGPLPVPGPGDLEDAGPASPDALAGSVYAAPALADAGEVVVRSAPRRCSPRKAAGPLG